MLGDWQGWHIIFKHCVCTDNNDNNIVILIIIAPTYKKIRFKMTEISACHKHAARVMHLMQIKTGEAKMEKNGGESD